MAATPQTQALQTINQMVSLGQQLLTIYQQMVIIDAAWTDDAMATTIAALKTATLAADGSIGAVDGSPNIAHPISPVDYPSLGRALSSNQVGQIKTILDGIVAYVGGQAVSTQASARGILNFTAGG